jgi:hypothetical protein
MKTLILAAIAATVLASAVSVQAADRSDRFTGASFFEDNARRSSGH